MVNLMLCSIEPIECCGPTPYCGIESDGRHFFVCGDGSSTINEITADGKIIRQICTRNPYRSLCYDNKNQAYWALSYTRKSIYLLTSSFQEIDCVAVQLPNCSPICDITYSHCSNSLVLCAPDALYKVVGGVKREKIVSSGSNERFQAAVEFHGNMTVVADFAHGPNIIRISENDAFLRSIVCLPDGHFAKSMCVEYCEGCQSYLYVLSTKKSVYSNLLKYQYLRMEKERTNNDNLLNSPTMDMTCIQTVQIN